MRRIINNLIRRAGIFALLIFILSMVLAGCSGDIDEATNTAIAEVSTEVETVEPEREIQETPEISEPTEQSGDVSSDRELTELPQETEAELVVCSDIDEAGTYTAKDDVALYIHTFGHLPSNYITKDQATALGWKDKGSLDQVAPGKSIGGDKFSNREKQLPVADGRKYFECDIDYSSGNRNAKRIVYSNDGLIFYTEDHYSTFTQLY